MNNLIASNIKTMSSREIAELTGKNHSDVCRDINNTLSQAEIGVSKFAGIWHDSQNRKRTEYNLPKRECDLVISGYSVKYRLAIIDRWQELEANNTPAWITNLSPQASAAIEDLNSQLEAAKPAIAFVENYVKSEGNKGFREVCKLLKANEHAFRAFLKHQKVMYLLNGAWTAYGCHLDAGRFEASTGTSNDHVFNQCKFTPKGVEWIAKLWASKVKEGV